jgi:hypothetical protein
VVQIGAAANLARWSLSRLARAKRSEPTRGAANLTACRLRVFEPKGGLFNGARWHAEARYHPRRALTMRRRGIEAGFVLLGRRPATNWRSSGRQHVAGNLG